MRVRRAVPRTEECENNVQGHVEVPSMPNNNVEIVAVKADMLYELF